MIRVQINDRALRDELRQIAARLGSPRPALKAIGETLAESTRLRFDSGTGPDGRRWAPNTETTILEYLGKYKGSFSRKTGKLTKTGSARISSKKPLIGETRSLMSTITWQMSGDNAVLVGSPMVYAVTQQFGAKARSFNGGRTPWGNIPARPFLGVSDSDRKDILDLFSDFLLRS